MTRAREPIESADTSAPGGALDADQRTLHVHSGSDLGSDQLISDGSLGFSFSAAGGNPLLHWCGRCQL